MPTWRPTFPCSPETVWGVSTVALRVTVVDAGLDPAAGMWGDPTSGWRPPAAEWVGRLRTLGVPCDIRQNLDAPVPGIVVAPDPDAEGVAGENVITGGPPPTGEATLRLLAAALGAVVVPDLRGVLVLRLDDPGAAVKVHLRSWAHPAVSAEAWAALWTAAGTAGRLSVFCCSGWVDDDGTVLDSRAASPEEWGHLDEGVARGIASLECHGWTHMHPDAAAWAGATDRHDEVAWFRELWPPTVTAEPSVDAQAERLRLWQETVGATGTTLVAPGEAWGLNTLAAARRRRLRLFNSWAICFLDSAMPTWSTGVGSPYLDQAAPEWYADCLPQVGYWHDRDMAIHGPSWVPDQLAAWRDCGVKALWSFADLVDAYGPIDAALVDGDVVVRSAPEVPLRVIRAGDG